MAKYRYGILAAAALAALICASRESPARPWPDTTDGIYVFNDQLTSGMGAPLTQFSATHYAGCQKMVRSDADALRAYNPDFLILHYRLGLGLGYRLPDAYGYPTGPYIEIIEGNNWVREWPASSDDQWFYQYAGYPQVYNNMWGWYLVDPDNAAWSSYWLGEVTRQLAANDNDGLFADSVSVPNYLDPYSFTPNLPEIDPVFESDWSAKIGRWTTWVRNGLGPSYKLIPNAGFWITTRDTTDYSGADGVMIEGFSMWGQSDPFELSDWQLQMNRVLNLVVQHRIVIAQAYIDRPDDMAYRSYVLASYLLVKGAQTFINLEMGSDPEWFPEYGVSLGVSQGGIPAGIGELYRDDWGVYAREYVNGLALVNPGSEPRTFDVGPGYRLVVAHGGGLVPENGDISGMYVTSTPISLVTLQPYSGAVLVKPGIEPGYLTVAPGAGFSSSGSEGGPFDPSSAQYTLTNTGGEPINWSVTHLPSANWLTISTTAGILPPGGSQTITLSINLNASGLPPGVYTDTVSFTNATSGAGNTARGVELSVAGVQPSGMLVTPLGDLVSSGPPGGPFGPGWLQYTVSNPGGFDLSFAVSHGPGGNWLTLCRTLPPDSSTTVTAYINGLAGALGPGVYSDTIAFANITDGIGDTTRSVQLSVLQGVLSVTPAGGLTSSGAIGGPFSPSSKDYTLTNTGNAPIDWTAAHDLAVNWVTLSAASGSLAAGANTTVTVSINSNANSLPGGVYSDSVSFTNTTNGVGSTTRPVSLTAASKTLTSVAVSSTALYCPSTDPRQLYATAYFSDSTSLDITSLGTWTSSKASVCTIDAAGLVTPVSQGSAGITCSYSYSGVTRTATCGVTVSYQTIWYLYMSPSSHTVYNRNPVQFACQARTTKGWINVTETCQWTSSNPAVATVNRGGLVTPLTVGSATITARYLYKGAYLVTSGTVNVY